MARFIVLIALGLAIAGCSGNSSGESDPVEVYQTVLQHQGQNPKEGEAIYLSVEEKDPADAILRRLRERWPTLQPLSQLPKDNKRHLVWNISQLKWLNSSTVEVRVGYSNGIDGERRLYRVVRKNGEWAVEKATTEIIS